MNTEALRQAAAEARGLAIDAIHACSSGHLGLPLGCAEIGAVLFSEALRHHPAAPKWLNRDRFVLSAGHGSMFLYSWLHLSGHDLSLQDLKDFRKLHSKTPGHPEFRETPGVEATTGPLGQGIANAAGYALSGKRAAAVFNTPDFTLFDHHVIALAGDGCLQEGVAREAIAFAGHNALDNLILIYDSNDVTLDAMAEVTQSEDTEKYFASQGWDAVTIDGHDLAAIAGALKSAKESNNGRPKAIIARTEIGRGIPQVAGTAAAHGEGGAKHAEEARAALGLPPGTFHVSGETRAHFAARAEEHAKEFAAWEKTYEAWSEAHPDLARQLRDGLATSSPSDLVETLPEFPADYADATRAAAGVVINHLAARLPHLLTASADLYGSTKNRMKDHGDFSAANPSGRSVWAGIREHAMAAICNGIAYDGLFRPSCATFHVFADYLRPSVRLAALARLPVIYILTHDSPAVGEDGPTHQPVETTSALRLIPGLDVIRPADPEETAGAWAAALMRADGPTALVLSRQKVPALSHLSVKERREGALRGGYVVKRETAPLDLILLATGSEVSLALEAAEDLGPGARVVSLPCFERFDRQAPAYQEEVLPAACTRRVAIEAGVTALWHKYTGTNGKIIGIDRFGLSAPGSTVLRELGIHKQALLDAAS